MNAVRCRRDATLETTPLSPTKYNGLPPAALDCGGLQRQLVDDDVPAYSCEVNVTGRPLPDDEGPLLDPPSSFHDRLIAVCPRVGQESTCQSESRDSDDVAARGYFRHVVLAQPMTSQPLSTLATDAVNGRRACECETAASAHENTGQVTHGLDVSSKSVPSFTDFRMFSSQLPQPRFSLEMNHGGKSLDQENLLVTSDNLPSNTQDADYVGFPSRCSLRSAESYALDKSQRSAVASFPVDTFQDPLVTVAVLLVNSAVNVAVRNLVDDDKAVSEPNHVNETDLVPTSDTSNSMQPLPLSDESTVASEDPVEAAARLSLIHI